MLLIKKIHKITYQDTRESRRKKHSNSKTAGKPTVRICTCLDSAGHLHKHHKPGFINDSSQKYLLDKHSDFKPSMSFGHQLMIFVLTVIVLLICCVTSDCNIGSLSFHSNV